MDILYVPFEYIMKLCLYISGNYYIIALFFFALIIQILLLPLGIKQHKSQITQRKLKPKEMAIRKKYAGRKDRATQQKMQLEIQEMYRNEGYNQFAGCLPMLIQLPIIFILFAIVKQPITYSSNSDILTPDDKLYEDAYYTVEQYENEELITKNDSENLVGYKEALNKTQNYLGYTEEDGELKINEKTRQELVLAKIIHEDYDYFKRIAEEHNLTLAEYDSYEKHFSDEQKGALPNFSFFNETLLDTPSFPDITSFRLKLIHLIPLLIFITSFFSGLINRKYMGVQTGPDGNPIGGGWFMTWGMPLMSLVFSFSFPAAIGIYWIWRTVVGAAQPVVLNHFYPMPVVSKEEIEAAEKEMKKKKKKKVITIEVDEDDDSYSDIEVKNRPVSSKKNDNDKVTNNKIEMLSADDDDEE